MKDEEKKRIGLLFGSFNPIHNGHVLLGKTALDENLVEEVWFVVSPHNPDKSLDSLAPFPDRVAMVRHAVEGIPAMLPCDIEDKLPRPSYTFTTLRALRDKYPDYTFSIIAGDDILRSILSWKQSEEIIAHHDLIIKNRSNATVDVPPGVRAQFLPGVIELSATDVRGMIANSIKPLEIIPEAVHEYIKEKGLYR